MSLLETARRELSVPQNALSPSELRIVSPQHRIPQLKHKKRRPCSYIDKVIAGVRLLGSVPSSPVIRKEFRRVYETTVALARNRSVILKL